MHVLMVLVTNAALAGLALGAERRRFESSLRRWAADQDHRIRLAAAEGPDCYCGHGRLMHLAMAEIGVVFDGACSVRGCLECEDTGYLPVEGAYVVPPLGDPPWNVPSRLGLVHVPMPALWEEERTPGR